MDYFSDYANYSDPDGPQRLVMGNSVNFGRKGSHGFLQKLFSRQPSTQKLHMAGLDDPIGHLSLENSRNSNLELGVMPCPYIRPLGIRLEPRVENAPRRPLADHTVSISRKKAEPSRAAHNCLQILQPVEDLPKNPSVSDIMTLRGSRLLEDIAAAATTGSSHLKDWGDYIKCYAEGRYSLSMPPGPPPMNSNFTYLPCPYPPEESERLAAFHSLHIWSGTDIYWSGLEAERARDLIREAAVKFGTPWGAISFFDEVTEIVQAERGYSRHFIPRRESIASHVLLTGEVMTVFDTHQDWRFIANPLVTGNPKIRFFAGAPLLSANSQVIGVFAIFSPEPRQSFTPMQRRDLASFSELVTRDLTVRLELPTTSISDQGSPTLRSSCDDGALSSSRPTSSPHSSVISNGRGNSSTTLRYHKILQDGNSKSRFFIDSDSQAMSLQNLYYTPPTSEDSDAGPSPTLKGPKRFGKNPKQLSLEAWSNPAQIHTETPDSPTFGEFEPNFGKKQPRVSSTSDLTSLNQKPQPCTNKVDRVNENRGRSPAACRRATDTFSQGGTVVVPLTPNPNSPSEQISDTSSFLFDTEGREDLLDEAVLFGEILDTKLLEEYELLSTSTSEAKEPVAVAVKMDLIQDQQNGRTSSVSTDSTRRKVYGLGIQAEARFAAELWAKNLAFDVIYAVEIIPKRIFMSESELKVPGNVKTRILVSYGLDENTDFDVPIHLKVLHGSGATTWQNDDGMPNGYNRGFMIPLVFDDGMLHCRSGGVVFGAFRRRPDGTRESPRLKSAEVDRLRQAAAVLRDILTKCPSLRWPDECEGEPLSMPIPQPQHLRNRAIEVGKYSLDARIARFAQTGRRTRRRLKSYD